MHERGSGGGWQGSQAKKGLTAATKGVDRAAMALDRLSKVTNAASSGVKRMQKAVRDLFSFDQINRLSKVTGKTGKKSGGRSRKRSGSSSRGSKKQLDILRQAAKWMEKLKKLAERLVAPLRKIWALKGWKVVDAFQELQKSAKKLADQVNGGLKWGYENVLKPLATWAIGEAVPAAIEALAGAFELVSATLEVLAPIGQGIWENFLEPLAAWTGGAIVEILEGVGDVFRFLAEQMQKVADVLGSEGGVWEKIETLATSIGEALDGGIQEALQEAGNHLVQWFDEKVVQPLQKALDGMPDLGLMIQLLLSKSPEELWESFQTAWGSSKAVQVLVKLAKDGWSSVKDWIGNNQTLQAAVKLVKSGWSSISGFVGTKVSAAVKLTKSGWSSLSKFVGTKVSVGIKLVKSGWKSVKSWLGNLTAKFNIKLPKVSVTWSGSPIKLPHFKIRWNAKGAILDGATLFGMAGNSLLGGGEAGREAVLPLDRNTSWMDELAEKVARLRDGGGSGGNQSITVYVTLDGKVVGKSVVNYAIGEAKATGQLPWAAYN